MVFLLWAVALVAGRLGGQDGRRDAEHLADRTAVVVYSADRLMLGSLPAQDEVCLDAGVPSPYPYRCTGRRLLAARGGRYHVLPVGRRRGIDPLYVVNEGPGLRVELVAGTR